MSIVAFDTLKFVETLEAAGITRAHAKATAQAVAEGFVMAELATKHDIVAVKHDIAAVKTELKNDIAMVRTEIVALEQRMTTGFRDIEQRMTIKLGGMMMAIAVLIVAAIKYLPPGH